MKDGEEQEDTDRRKIEKCGTGRGKTKDKRQEGIKEQKTKKTLKE